MLFIAFTCMHCLAVVLASLLVSMHCFRGVKKILQIGFENIAHLQSIENKCNSFYNST